MKIKAVLGIIAVLLYCGTALAQDDAHDGTKENIRLFQSFFEDAHVTPEPYIDGEFDYSYYDNVLEADYYTFALRMGLPLNPETELHFRLGIATLDPDGASSETSITDLYLGGRHLLMDRTTKVAAGGYVTIPTGKEEAWQDNFDAGIYTALRHPLDKGIVLTGTIGLMYTEKYDSIPGPGGFGRNNDHEATLRIGGGAIYEYTDEVNFVGEAVMESRHDYMLLTGGIDYAIDRKSSLRAALGVGVDTGAPDMRAMLSYFFLF